MNFTISAKFHNPGILVIPGVREVSQYLRCYIFGFVVERNTAEQSSLYLTKIFVNDYLYQWPAVTAIGRKCCNRNYKVDVTPASLTFDRYILPEPAMCVGGGGHFEFYG